MNLLSLKTNPWKQYASLISSINQMEAELQSLSASALKERSWKLQQANAQSGLKVDEKSLVESFALVREASRRTLGLRHYDTQLLGGLVLNDNKIAEMCTGEGKTLVATAPAFANALSGKGVHIVTVNEYLAQRDAESMGQIYRYLGLSVGLVQAQMKSFERKKNYNRHLTYLTSSELGFDYLRDNLATQTTELVQRPFHYCIVDEVDSILIDEARTPLIISKQFDLPIEKIIKATEVVKFLKETQDYVLEQKSKNVNLTSLGVRKTQRILKVETLFNPQDPWILFILNALKAKTFFLKNVHYMVKQNELSIVDEFTGRILEGRKWAEGLHNAIEVKEGIYNMEGSETIASITFQNFYRLYPKMSGMTGTAKTEELEFEKIYNLKVSKLPTYKPMIRVDFPDAIYKDEITKWKAILQECKRMYDRKRPILLGTTTIHDSEVLSRLLSDLNIPHQLLNAKPENIDQESKIIAQAGCLGSVTVATNMAGRGTDVLLGGNPEFKASAQTMAFLKTLLTKEELPMSKEMKTLLDPLKTAITKNRLTNLETHFETFLSLLKMPTKSFNAFEDQLFQLYQHLLKTYQLDCNEEKTHVLRLGGLYVIGTARHESRRIDNQLRGRAGRQGDPGSSRFFLSLQDSLLKTFGGEKIQGLLEAFQMNEEALESTFLSQALDSAQQKVEGFYYDQRKTVNKYDAVLDKQRSIFYQFRKKVLFSPSLRDFLLEFGEALVDDLVQHLKPKDKERRLPKLINAISHGFSFSIETEKAIHLEDLQPLKLLLYEQFWSAYSFQEFHLWIYNLEFFRMYEKFIVLKYLDFYWAKHLEEIGLLKDLVSWEAYAQKDPFLQYEEQAAIYFKNTFRECRETILYYIVSFHF